MVSQSERSRVREQQGEPPLGDGTGDSQAQRNLPFDRLIWLHHRFDSTIANIRCRQAHDARRTAIARCSQQERRNAHDTFPATYQVVEATLTTVATP